MVRTAGAHAAGGRRRDRLTPGSGGSRPGYWPGLDGMRAIAVAAVVAYHMEPGWLPGGFFGVDVFFVISGYLITSMLAGEWSRRGGIEVGRFWLRRVRRLFPAVVTVVVVVVVVAAVVAPDALVPTRAVIPAALVYLTNWWFIFHRVPYFQSIGRPPLLLHFWSLAIEEQYYLIWPPILLLLLSRLRRPGRVAGLALGGAVASGVLMAVLFHSGGDTNRVYYGTDTHSQGLLLGSALGLVVPPGQLSARVTAAARHCLDGAGVVALAVIGIMMFTVGQSKDFTWRGGLDLVVVLAGVATVVAAHPASRLSRALAVPPLRWLGTRSYSVYLWHWPILDLTRAHLDVGSGGLRLAAVQLGLIGVAAEASYRFVEQPWRTGKAEAWLREFAQGSRRHREVSFGAAAGVVIVVVVLLASASTPPPPPDLRITATAAARERIIEAASPGSSTVAPGSSTTAASTTSAPTTSASTTSAPITSASTTSASVGSQSLPTDGPPNTVAPSTTTSSTTTTSTTTPPTTTPPSTSPVTISAVPGLLEAPPGGPVLAIGDSVMLASRADLQAAFGAGITVDAAVGRQVAEGLERLEEYREAGRLDGLRALVIDLGSNGPFQTGEMQQFLAVAAGVPHIVFVNVRVPLPWQSESNATINGVAVHAQCSVVNWYGASAQPGLLYPDDVHPDPAGQLVYTNLVTRAVGS